MNFEITSKKLDQISSDGLVLFAFEGDKFVPTKNLLYVDKILNGFLFNSLYFDNFKGKKNAIFSFDTQKKILASKIFVLGLGKKEEFDQNKLRSAIATFAKNYRGKLSSVSLGLLTDSETKQDIYLQSQSIAEGFILGNYLFNKYKKKDDNLKELETIIISEENKASSIKIKEGIETAKLICEGVILARDLVNEPAAVITPTSLAKIASDLAKKNKEITCKIYEREEIEKMGMGAFLGVALGSDTPPKFIHLEYSPAGSIKKEKLAIVGKGITFDSGGVSIKPESSMMTMKCDMAGAAAVLGVFSVISQIKPKMKVMGIIAATPNLISGKAFVPGDILTSMSGKTIEVLSTDAEGRLTMADAFTYTIKKGATEIIDLATLTGACEVALGTDIAGLFSNNDSLKEKLLKSSKKTGEHLWELPLLVEYKELNKSDVADISNIPSTRYGGAITGGLFLQEFVEEKPWVHLDISGPAFYEKEHELGQKGGTGFGVRLLIDLLKDL